MNFSNESQFNSSRQHLKIVIFPGNRLKSLEVTSSKWNSISVSKCGMISMNSVNKLVRHFWYCWNIEVETSPWSRKGLFINKYRQSLTCFFTSNFVTFIIICIRNLQLFNQKNMIYRIYSCCHFLINCIQINRDFWVNGECVSK